MYAVVNERGKLDVHVDEDDLCLSCKNKFKCPLIQALSKEYAFLHYSEVEVSQCGLFKK